MKYNKETMPEAGGIAARQGKGPLWFFLPGSTAAFLCPDADMVSRLYFPLFNVYGMKCAVTPELKGDIASSFRHFLTPATGTEELHRNVAGRNFWITPKGLTPWSVAGNSAFQKAGRWTGERDPSEVEGHIGAFIARRLNTALGLESEATLFVPHSDDFVEVMKVTVTNTSNKEVVFTPTAATPIFGRHADNFRDHRQVTTMFQQTFAEPHGVRVKPMIVHDEHGHSVNTVRYYVLGFEADGTPPAGIWPLMSAFTGEGGSLDNPESVFRQLPPPEYHPDEIHGKEALGAMRFAEKCLGPGESATYIILHGISENDDSASRWKEKYGNAGKADAWLGETLAFWQKTANAVSLTTADNDFDNWAKWVAFQLKCRQIYGNSFLPDFGYGRGGRGWRDLWQDLLSIFLVDPAGAREEILNNFRGIRVDGSNATIIGNRPGEFVADRNNVPRTWCDHGAWPVYVLDFYIHQTGDDAILSNDIPYWKDNFTHRSKGRDTDWEPSQGNLQKDKQGQIVYGSILEHLLLQQLSAFFHVGGHNNLLLEGGDWNDTLDMAREKGESVCFHAFYAHNLTLVADILAHIYDQGTPDILLMEEVCLLLDRLPGQMPVNYDAPEAKQSVLQNYFEQVKHQVSGRKIAVKIPDLIADLRAKSAHSADHIRHNEWITTRDGHGFFNGHYDNLGRPLHGDSPEGMRIDLTSQVIPLMCDVASPEQIARAYSSVRHYLHDPGTPGLRLCTEFKAIDLNIGRISGFAYGYKEHGSKWSQQNIMLMYALYRRGYVKEGYEMLSEIWQLANNSARALIFPGIPSYFEPGDRGAYAYLTGSSAWLLLAIVTRIFGVRGHQGHLVLHPLLHAEQFDIAGNAVITCNFRDRRIRVCYQNAGRNTFGEYRIGKIAINGQIPDVVHNESALAMIRAEVFDQLCDKEENLIEVELLKKQ
jgi:cellobiose phosphorylase